MTTHIDSPSEAPADAASTSSKGFNKEDLVRTGYEYMHRALDFGERKYQRALGRAVSATRDGPVGGLCGVMARLPFTPEQILFGYAQGMFPMDKRGQIYWNCPNPRCAVPLDQLRIPSRIARYLRSGLYELCFDRDPAKVLASCGDRTETWLSARVQAAYLELFQLGAMHTVEAYQGERLVGGAFGIALGSVFTLESMFSHEDHASKLCFAYICQHLVACGFTLADCQYQSPHVERFGAIELPRDEYRSRVAHGLIHPASFKLEKPGSAASKATPV
jgi:leucyl/phenylalanyl-tRNA---protein transferase